VLLNVGGDVPGWTNVDLYAGGNVRGDATCLPFPDGVFDRVLLSHVLEHIPWEQAPQAVSEARRVTRPGGLVCLRGPDCLASAPIQAKIGRPDVPGMAHEWECDQSRMDELAAGLEPVESSFVWPESSWPFGEVEIVGRV
jgi:SAM-dependent methyltransferase